MEREHEANLIEKTIASKDVFKGRIIKVRVDTVLLPDGNTATREVVEHPGAVVILAINDRDEIIMVRQYRHATGEVLLELPAGKRDPNENPLICAQRELEEETGYSAREWHIPFSFYTSPGFCNELLYFVVAKGLVKGESHPDGEEFLEVLKVPVEEARRMVASGEIKDAKTILGILALPFLEESRGVG
ncbi:MAG: NUDIX domain-containing protein [Thermacetogeniaceae bacterium]